MIKVKEQYKSLNVPYKGKTLGTLEGDDLKKYVKAYLNGNNPNIALKYFDNTIDELKDFVNGMPKKQIKKPEITEE